MNEPRISRFPIPEFEELPTDIQQSMLEAQEKLGFIPNVFLALSHRPDEFRAFFAFRNALMEKSDGLSKADREMIVVATSGQNNCQYCVVSHGAMLRIHAQQPLIADQVAVNYKKADITPKQMVMLDFAVKVCNDSWTVGEDDYQQMHAAGFSDEDIWDVVSITSFYGMSNRLANALAMVPNADYYSMGRKFD